MKHEELLMELMYSGRHYKICIIINVQDIKGVGPGTRGNMDIIAITYQTQERTLKAFGEEYGKFWHNKEVFPLIIRLNTQDYKMIIVNQGKAKYRPEDVFFTDLANPDPDPYAIGDKKFWKDSGCNWEKQVVMYNNIPKFKTKDLEQMAEERWKNQDRDSNGDWIDTDDYKPISLNQEWFNTNKPEKKKRKSHVEEIRELISKKNFGVNYVPGPFAGIDEEDREKFMPSAERESKNQVYKGKKKNTGSKKKSSLKK
jgi:hypothetical protein